MSGIFSIFSDLCNGSLCAIYFCSSIPECNNIDEEELKYYTMLLIPREGKYVLV